jgi:hypothetical protein
MSAAPPKTPYELQQEREAKRNICTQDGTPHTYKNTGDYTVMAWLMLLGLTAMCCCCVWLCIPKNDDAFRKKVCTKCGRPLDASLQAGAALCFSPSLTYDSAGDVGTSVGTALNQAVQPHTSASYQAAANTAPPGSANV